MAAIFSGFTKVKFCKIYSKYSITVSPIGPTDIDPLLPPLPPLPPIFPEWLNNNFNSLNDTGIINLQLHANNANIYSLISGNLPTGLTLSSSGMLSGIISNEGTFNFILRARNADGYADKSFSILVKKLIQFSLNS